MKSEKCMCTTYEHALKCLLAQPNIPFKKNVMAAIPNEVTGVRSVVFEAAILVKFVR